MTDVKSSLILSIHLSFILTFYNTTTDSIKCRPLQIAQQRIKEQPITSKSGNSN